MYDPDDVGLPKVHWVTSFITVDGVNLLRYRYVSLGHEVVPIYERTTSVTMDNAL